MPKLAPGERWRHHVTERYQAFLSSRSFESLRREGLSIVGRRQLLTTEEFWLFMKKGVSSERYMAWYQRCARTGRRFGLASWTVEMACLLEGYEPWTQPHPVEASWPTVRIITENDDPLFLNKLCHVAWNLGLDVVLRRDQTEAPLMHAHFAAPPDEPLPESRRPPRDLAFRIRVEYPPLYPSEARQHLDKELSQIERRLLRGLGYPVPQRLRASPLVSQAGDLKVVQGKLPSGGIYDIIDAVYSPVDGQEDADLSKDQLRRKLIKSQRSRLKKRLIKPYKVEES